jgi:hypothetical protein
MCRILRSLIPSLTLVSLLVVGPPEEAQVDEGGLLVLEHRDHVIERLVRYIHPVYRHEDVPPFNAPWGTGMGRSSGRDRKKGRKEGRNDGRSSEKGVDMKREEEIDNRQQYESRHKTHIQRTLSPVISAGPFEPLGMGLNPSTTAWSWYLPEHIGCKS